jgi:hypothetical protein
VIVEVDIGISPSLYKKGGTKMTKKLKRLRKLEQERYAGERTNRRRGLNDYRGADAEGLGESWRNLVDVGILTRRREALPVGGENDPRNSRSNTK